VTVVIGIDADTRRLAYCVLDGRQVRAVRTIQRADSRGRVFHSTYDAALTRFMRRAQDVGGLVFVEGIFLTEFKGHATARNVLGFSRLAEVAGELKRVARLHAVPLVVVPASTWRAEVLGFVKDREKLKAAAMAKARELTGRDDLTEHESEACCIALFGQRDGVARDEEDAAMACAP